MCVLGMFTVRRRLTSTTALQLTPATQCHLNMHVVLYVFLTAASCCTTRLLQCLVQRLMSQVLHVVYVM